jgi:trk system potassium uptake protein TrkH
MEQRIHQLLLRGQLRKKSDHATRVLLAFFLVTIALGAILLALPVASRSGTSCGPMTALFTATSAACVTGLSLVDTYTQWSGFGQGVLLCLIQIGGLGYMTFVSIFYFLLRRKIGLRERLILQQAMALNELDGVIQLVQLVLAGTFAIEGSGAVVLTLRFCRQMPVGQAVWMGVFHAISAYCNAGFDLMGRFLPGSSLSLYVTDGLVNVTLMALILLGGLGFFVWNDLLMHQFRWKRLSVHTRLVLIISLILVLGGAGCILALEWANPATLGGLTGSRKVLAALFQAVTCRTAGFYAVDQGGLTGSGKLVSILLMLVGGSSGSTAGGIKTVTVGLLFLTAVRVLRNRKDIVVFRRKIPQEQVNSAVSISILVVTLALAGGVIVSATNGVSLGDALYESVSAICTVGLSTGITAGLNLGSKILLMLYMFFGRVGIMTISFAFMTKTPPDNAIGRPETRVLVG